MCGKQKRIDLFKYYSKNLSIYSAGYDEHFQCPICLSYFDLDKLDQLSIAHVLPEKLGGNLCTLSCAACDQRIGHEFNWHAVTENKARIRQNEPVYGRFIPKKGSSFHIKSKWNLERSTIEIYPPSDNISKDVWRTWIDEIRTNSQGRGPYEFSIETKRPSFVPTKRDISYIHSAVLMMFYEFGYEYILSSNINEIRKMLMGSTISWKPSKLFRSLRKEPEFVKQSFKLPLIGIVKEPKGLCSFAIFFPSLDNADSSIVIFLPGIDDDFCNFYANLSLIQSPNKKITAIFPTQISNKINTIRYHLDISDPLSKGVANHIYQICKEIELADIKSLDIRIQSRDRTRRAEVVSPL